MVDLSSGIAGAYCTKILADAGARVIKVEASEGDELRRWRAGGPLPEGEDGALFQFLSCSKHSVVVDPAQAGDEALLRALIAAAHVAVWSPGSRLAERPENHPHALRQLAPGAVVIALTPFGLDGPWAARPATEFTLQAWSGGIGNRGSVRRPPVQAGGRTGDWATGMLAALGVLAARWRALRLGEGELLDVSVLESLALTHSMYPVTFRSIAGRPLRMTRTDIFPGIERAKDGYVGIMVTTGQQWLDFCAMVQRPEWIDDPELLTFAKRFFRRDELAPQVAEWMTQRTTAEVIELADLHRVPAAPLGNGATVTTFDHFLERGSFVENPRGGFVQPAHPFRLSGGAALRPFEPAPSLGEHTDRYRSSPPPLLAPAAGDLLAPVLLPFEGLRVADFTAFWAGPIVGHLLAMLGADVIHVESPKRPDGMRSQPVVPMDRDQWWEWSPLYHGPNTNKRDVAIDMRTEQGLEIARRLIASCDAVVENYSPRVMEGLGLGYEQIRRLRSDIIMLRMPGYGLDGPWRDRGGYAQTMEQVSGLAWITGHPDEPPEVPNGPCDPIAGSHATIALLLALEHRRKTGAGMLVESTMVDAALQVAAEQVLEYTAYGTLLERQGNRGPTAAPQGLFRTADTDFDDRGGRWVAIAVENDAQWSALCDGIGRPGWSADPAYRSEAGRRRAQGAIETGLAAWCAERCADDIIDRLWSAGVPVGKVMMQDEQDDVEQLRARGYFHVVRHPITGANLHAGHPVRFERGPTRLHRRHAPLLGQDNEEILGELGFSDEEIKGFVANGVIGRRPPI